ncbi:MAG: GHMP kinase [Methanosarcinales archaeon]|nr:GHMP kinase [Methanosarcinales archaeon]
MKAFVPGHITGFFAVKRDIDPFRAGSVGCGMTLGVGATTWLEPLLPGEESEVILNGQPSPAPVSRQVIDFLAPGPVRVQTDLQMVMGAGFGASGCGALGAAYLLNARFNLALTSNQVGAVAHQAEVANGTGLGDVIAQNTGGLVIRLHPGAPGTGVVDRIPIPPTRVYCLVRGPMSTSQVLSDPEVMREVNRAGERAVKELLARPTLEEFMRLSARFARESGLARDWMLDAMEAVEARGGQASMIMLGDSLFAVGEESEEALREFGPVVSTYVTKWGAYLD